MPVFLSRRPEEPVDTELQLFYQRLLRALHFPIFHRGYWQFCESAGWPDNQTYMKLLAWTWCDGDSRLLIVVNYSDQPAAGRIRIQGNDLRDHNWRLNEILYEVTYERHGNELISEGLYVALGPWKAHLFRFHMV